MEKTSNNIPSNIKDLELMLEMLNNFVLTIKSIVDTKKEASVLNFGSGDLKMTNLLLGEIEGNINFYCYDPIYSDDEKLKEYIATSKLSTLENAEKGIILEYLKDKDKLDNKNFDLLISNFCFHHFLETDTEENLKKQIQSINPETIIISEYNMNSNINEEDFKKTFTNPQEQTEAEEYKNDWKKLKDIHCKYNAKYYVELLESIGYKIENKENIQKSLNKFYLIAKRLTK